MTLTYISNAILGAVVLVAIVGKLVWAIATAHYDRAGLIVANRSREVAPRLDSDGHSQPMPELAII